MFRIYPVALAAAPVANQVSFGINFREGLCEPYCIDSSQQPFADVQYTVDLSNATLNGTTVFVPVTARISIQVPGDCPCDSTPQVFTEQFYVQFQGQTELPANVTVESVGRVQNGADVECGWAYAYSINDSLVATLTPRTAAATAATTA